MYRDDELAARTRTIELYDEIDALEREIGTLERQVDERTPSGGRRVARIAINVLGALALAFLSRGCFDLYRVADDPAPFFPHRFAICRPSW